MGISQEDIDILRENIAKLQAKNIVLYISIVDGRTKTNRVESHIVGVYKNFFAVKSQVGSYFGQYTIKYIDVLTKKVIIENLEENL